MSVTFLLDDKNQLVQDPQNYLLIHAETYEEDQKKKCTLEAKVSIKVGVLGTSAQLLASSKLITKLGKDKGVLPVSKRYTDVHPIVFINLLTNHHNGLDMYAKKCNIFLSEDYRKMFYETARRLSVLLNPCVLDFERYLDDVDNVLNPKKGSTWFK